MSKDIASLVTFLNYVSPKTRFISMILYSQFDLFQTFYILNFLEWVDSELRLLGASLVVFGYTIRTSIGKGSSN